MTFPPRTDISSIRQYDRYQYLHMRRYFEVELSGSPKDDEVHLEAARSLITQMVERNDTITGVHIRLRKGAKYWSLIRAVDICEQAGQRIYVVCDSDMWVLRMSHSEKLLESVKREKEAIELHSIPSATMGYK